MLFCMEYLKFALRLIWKKFSIRYYIENKEIFLTTLYGKPKPHKKVIFKALLRLFMPICDWCGNANHLSCIGVKEL